MGPRDHVRVVHRSCQQIRQSTDTSYPAVQTLAPSDRTSHPPPQASTECRQPVSPIRSDTMNPLRKECCVLKAVQTLMSTTARCKSTSQPQQNGHVPNFTTPPCWAPRPPHCSRPARPPQRDIAEMFALVALFYERLKQLVHELAPCWRDIVLDLRSTQTELKKGDHQSHQTHQTAPHTPSNLLLPTLPSLLGPLSTLSSLSSFLAVAALLF